MADAVQFPWVFVPGDGVFLVWDAECGGYRLDPDALPDERLLVDLARRGLSGTSGWRDTAPADDEPVFVVGLLRAPAAAADPVGEPPAVRHALPPVPKPSGTTQATRAGWGGVFYPFANQRDGQPRYDTPTGAGGHGPEGPRIA